MGQDFSIIGGSINADIYKNILINGIKLSEGKELLDTTPYVLDKELSTKYVQVYSRLRDGGTDMMGVNKYSHVIINHRASYMEDENTSELTNIATYAVSESLYQLITNRMKESKDVQKKAVEKYDLLYNKAMLNAKIPAKKKHVRSIISTIGFSQGGILAEFVGEGTYEIITYNEASKPKLSRAIFRNLGLTFNSGYTPIIRIRTDGDPISYFNKSNMAITLTPPKLTEEQEKNRAIEIHKAVNMNLENYNDKFFGVNGLGDSQLSEQVQVYGVDEKMRDKILNKKKCNIM